MMTRDPIAQADDIIGWMAGELVSEALGMAREKEADGVSRKLADSFVLAAFQRAAVMYLERVKALALVPLQPIAGD